MLVLFLGCVQLYLILRMSFFDFYSKIFFYGISFLMLCVLLSAFFKKKIALFISTAIFIIAFISVRLSLRQIEDYYFERTISKAFILKTDLKEYKKFKKIFPDSLNELYNKAQSPQYNIGLFKYNFSYYKTDTSYKLYFNHFEGSMFRNNGESDAWYYYD